MRPTKKKLSLFLIGVLPPWLFVRLTIAASQRLRERRSARRRGHLDACKRKEREGGKEKEVRSFFDQSGSEF
jgi:hypothetical protein